MTLPTQLSPKDSSLTPIMEDADRQQSRTLSLRGCGPPLDLPGYTDWRFLGQGAYGEVWVAVHANSGRKVAIKFYSRRSTLDWSLLAREVEKLRHLFADRYVVQLFEVGWDAEPAYYVMEYMENGSLEQRLRDGPLSVEEALTIFRELAVGLAHAHAKGILHCDLKPANVLIDQDGKPRLADFGQSRLSNDQSPALGTLFYMAPEQADMTAVPDVRWDVYALGAVLYRMLTGAAPYRGEAKVSEILGSGGLDQRLLRYRTFIREAPPPRMHRQVPGVDRDLARIIENCLAVKPHRRFASVQAVIHALDARASGRARRPLLIVGVLAPVLIVLALGGIVGGMMRSGFLAAKEELIERQREENRFTAEVVSERFADEIENRWRILQAEAAEPCLAEWVALGIDIWKEHGYRAERDALMAWLSQRHEHYNTHYFTPHNRADRWFMDDRQGFEIAISPEDDLTLRKNYSFRDYFRGTNALIEGDVVTIIRRPHCSSVYLTQFRGTKAPTVTFSVPVYPAGDNAEEGEPIGILAMAVNPRDLIRLPDSEEQFPILIDTRPDWARRRWSVLPLGRSNGERIPLLATESVKGVPYLIDDRIRADAEELVNTPLVGAATPQTKVYPEDPSEPVLGPPPGEKPWLGALAPVIVREPDGRPAKTGFVVLIQQDYDSITLLEDWGSRVATWAVAGLAVVIVLMGALWYFVIFILNASPESRWGGRMRRAGLGSGDSSHSGSSSSSGSSRPSDPGRRTPNG